VPLNLYGPNPVVVKGTFTYSGNLNPWDYNPALTVQGNSSMS
jgi:hypothetical protein